MTTKEKWEKIQELADIVASNYEPGYVDTELAMELAALSLQLEDDLGHRGRGRLEEDTVVVLRLRLRVAELEGALSAIQRSTGNGFGVNYCMGIADGMLGRRK